MEFGNIEGLEVGIILQSRREMKYFAYHKEIFNEKTVIPKNNLLQ